MTVFDIHAELHEFSTYSLGFEIGTWYVLVSFAKWSLEITLKLGEGQ